MLRGHFLILNLINPFHYSAIMKKVSESIRKLAINLKLDFIFLTTSKISFLNKTSYLFRKYYSILLNKRKINYLGDYFEYDNLFVPAILQGYPKEIISLDKKINLKKITSCLDIGANIGQFSYTLKKFFPEIQIYSFEPIDLVFKILKNNTSYFNKIRVYNLAIGDRDGISSFYFSPEASAEGSFIKDNLNQNYVRKNIKKIKVKTVNLSKKNMNFLKIPSNLDLIKIDVEGFESEVLRSLKNIKFKYLYIEVSTSKRKGASVKDVERILKKDLKRDAKLIYFDLPEKSSPAANALFEIKN